MNTYSLVIGGGGGNGTLRTAVARVAGVDDGDLARVGRGALGKGVGGGQDREEESGDFGVHFEVFVVGDGRTLV